MFKRNIQKVFGSKGARGQFGQIGSAVEPSEGGVTGVFTKDLAEIKALDRYSQGIFATTSPHNASRAPYAEDVNSFNYMVTT